MAIWLWQTHEFTTTNKDTEQMLMIKLRNDRDKKWTREHFPCAGEGEAKV